MSRTSRNVGQFSAIVKVMKIIHNVYIFIYIYISSCTKSKNVMVSIRNSIKLNSLCQALSQPMINTSLRYHIA